MSLLFNMLSRLVITFLPRSKRLLIFGCNHHLQWFWRSKKWMWELDHKASWAWKNWCFWTVVLEKTLESPLDCKESILKEISPEYLLEGLILKLKLQYIGHLMWRTDSVEKTFMLGKIEGRRGRDEREWDGWMASLTRWTWPWLSSRGADGQGSLVCCSLWGCKELDRTEWLNWRRAKIQ